MTVRKGIIKQMNLTITSIKKINQKNSFNSNGKVHIKKVVRGKTNNLYDEQPEEGSSKFN